MGSNTYGLGYQVHMWYTCIHVDNTHTHKTINKSFKKYIGVCVGEGSEEGARYDGIGL